MIDVINALNNLRPAAEYEGCIEYQRPIGVANGLALFRNLDISEIQAQYEALVWRDKDTTKPAWGDIVAYDTEHPPRSGGRIDAR